MTKGLDIKGQSPKRVVFFANYLHQPRVIRRIQSFIDQGVAVEVYGVDRRKYTQNLPFPVTVLVVKEDGAQHFSTLLKLQKKVAAILKNHRGEDVIYYCFGMLTALPVFLTNLLRRKSKRVRYVYEISDLQYFGLPWRPIHLVGRWLDRKLISGAWKTAVTSQGFESWIFGTQGAQSLVYLPNVLHASIRDVPIPEAKIRTSTLGISFGFVGSIRWPRTVGRFAETIGMHFPQHQFHFFGISQKDAFARKIASNYPNVFFHGPFRNPDDLPRIYAGIDCVVASYDPDENPNARYLEPNKLYEAIFFRKPILVTAHTHLAERVAQLRCGFAIDWADSEGLDAAIRSLTPEVLDAMVAEIGRIPQSVAIDDQGHMVGEVL